MPSRRYEGKSAFQTIAIKKNKQAKQKKQATGKISNKLY